MKMCFVNNFTFVFGGTDTDIKVLILISIPINHYDTDMII